MNLLNVIARTSEGLGSGAERMRVLLIVFQDWLVVGGFMFVSSLKSDDDPESKPDWCYLLMDFSW